MCRFCILLNVSLNNVQTDRQKDQPYKNEHNFAIVVTANDFAN